MTERSGIEYELVEGKGEPVVFIHGWLGSKDSWNQVRKKLDRENTQVFVSLRCHGGSKCSRFTIEDLAEDLEPVIEELDQEPVIVGHSLGGMVALEYASNYEVSKLILFGVPASTPEPENQEFDFYLQSLGEMEKEEWAREIVENYTDSEPLMRDARKELVETDEEKLRWGLKAMKQFDVRDRDFDLEAVVVAGERDEAITPEKSKETAELLEAELITLDTGHLMPWSSPREMAEIIEEEVEQPTG